MKISRARLQVLIREEIAKGAMEKNRRSASLPNLAERRASRQKAAMAKKPSGPMDISQRHLNRIIQEEMQGVLLELDDEEEEKDELDLLGMQFGLDDDDPQMAWARDGVEESAEFDDGVDTELSEGEDEVYEEGDGWEGPGKKGKYRPWADDRNKAPKKPAARKRPYGGGAGINPGGNPDPKAPMPDYMRGKTRNPKTGKDEPYEEGLDESDDWIQKADADIKRRGTKGRCTGDKFGSESCPEGSREYDLAKTFKKMAHDHD